MPVREFHYRLTDKQSRNCFDCDWVWSGAQTGVSAIAEQPNSSEPTKERE